MFCIILQIAFQAVVVVYSYKTYKVLNNGNWWWLLCVGFSLMTLRRLTNLVTFRTYQNVTFLIFLDRIFIPLVISILLICGMIKIYRLSLREKRIQLEAQQNLKNLQKLTKNLTKKRCLLYEK
jgi:hypothetical protein